jgi:serine/threonine protein kinase
MRGGHMRISIVIFFLCLSPFFAQANAISALEKAAHDKDFKAIAHLLHHDAGKINLITIQNIAKNQSCLELFRAASAARNFATLDETFDLSHKEFLEMAFFIQSHILSNPALPSRYFSEKKTGFECPIEYDKDFHHAFIILDDRHDSELGVGKKKEVTKAILYDLMPQIVARGSQKESLGQEGKFSRIFASSPGVIQTLGFGGRKHHGRSPHVIYTKLYNKSSLQNLFDDDYDLTLLQKMQIASDILSGLATLHTHGAVHRDLGAKNYFAEIIKSHGKKVPHAVVADLGRTRYIQDVAGVPAQGNKLYLAPEGFLYKRMRGADYFATDIFATGCVFYHLLKEKWAPWQKPKICRNESLSRSKISHILTHKINSATSSRRHALAIKKASGTISPKNEFELLILEMLNSDPLKRPSAASLQVWMQEILNKEMLHAKYCCFDREEAKALHSLYSRLPCRGDINDYDRIPYTLEAKGK